MSISNTNASIWKGRWAAIVAVALSLVVALGFALPAQASAAQDNAGLAAGSTQLTTQESVYMADPENVDLWAGNTSLVGLPMYLYGTYDNLKVTKVASSNSGVLKVKQLNTQQEVWSYEVYPLKAGNATLSVTLTQNGATKTLSQTYTVKAFSNGISSITFNGKSLKKPTSTAAETTVDYFNFKGTSAKLEVKSANGWVINEISCYLYKPGDSPTSRIDVLNGDAFTIPKGYQASINIELYNANEDFFYYTINVYRNLPLKLAKETYYVGYPKISIAQYDYGSMSGNASKARVISVKSSKPAVIKATKNKNPFKVKLQAKKAGKSKITIKYTYEGKTYTTSAMCTVSAKYPLESVSVNGKSLNLKKYCYGYYPKKYKKAKAKVKVAAASGWKVASLKYYADITSVNAKAKKIKNGATVKTAKGKIAEVAVTLKKGKQTYTYYLDFNRKS